MRGLNIDMKDNFSNISPEAEKKIIQAKISTGFIKVVSSMASITSPKNRYKIIIIPLMTSNHR